jgi:hypothetical protein
VRETAESCRSAGVRSACCAVSWNSLSTSSPRGPLTSCVLGDCRGSCNGHFQKPRRLNGDQVPSPPISLSQNLMLPMSLFSRVLALPRRSLPSHEPPSHRVRDTPKNSSKHTCKCSRQSFSSHSTGSRKIPQPLSMSKPKLRALLSALFAYQFSCGGV